MVDVIKAKSTFDAQTVVIGWAVASIDADDFVVFDVVG